MKQSRWLENYEKDLLEEYDTNIKNKSILACIISLIFLAMISIPLTDGVIKDPIMQVVFIISSTIMLLVTIIVVVLLLRSKRPELASATKESVASLLDTDCDVDEFDRQMAIEPIKEVKTSHESYMFLTDDYVGKRFVLQGKKQYRFIKRRDIGDLNYYKLNIKSSNPSKQTYTYNVENAQGEVVISSIADTEEQLEDVKELLAIAQPKVQFNDKTQDAQKSN